MFKNLFSFFVLMAISSSALAMKTEDKSQSQLQEYGAIVAARATGAQWQTLWKNCRNAGHLQPFGDHHFTVGLPSLPDLSSKTLTYADEVINKDNTRATYRKKFDKEIGLINNVKVYALCLTVDFRAVFETNGKIDVPSVSGATLFLAAPCL